MRSRLLPGLCSLSMLVVGCATAPEETTATTKGDLAAYPVAPISQTVTLRIDPDRTDYSGSTRIQLDVREATDTFAFHANGIDIEKVELVERKNPFRQRSGHRDLHAVEP